jgi:hypothetical protein
VGRINGGSWWWRITSTILELKQGSRRWGGVVLMGELKGTTWCFGSASTRRERAVDGNDWRSGMNGSGIGPKTRSGPVCWHAGKMKNR